MNIALGVVCVGLVIALVCLAKVSKSAKLARQQADYYYREFRKLQRMGVAETHYADSAWATVKSYRPLVQPPAVATGFVFQNRVCAAVELSGPFVSRVVDAFFDGLALLPDDEIYSLLVSSQLRDDFDTKVEQFVHLRHQDAGIDSIPAVQAAIWEELSKLPAWKRDKLVWCKVDAQRKKTNG